MFLCHLGGTPTLLPNTMESQLKAVRQDICSVKDKILAIEQDLATAKQTNNKEQERFLCDLLLSLSNQLGGLNNQLSGLQEEKNVLLREQASSKQCLELVRT